MNIAFVESVETKNIESSFTELFTLLKRYECHPTGVPTLAYTNEELKVINKHIDNAVEVLLQGLQGMGQLLGNISSKNKFVNEVNQIGYFISAISNLTEALNDLRSDTDHVLNQRVRGD